MKLFAAVLLIASVLGWGQTSPSKEEICLMKHGKNYCAFTPSEIISSKYVKPAPLKCDDKYEYVAYGMKDGKYGEMCAPIMHTVTEKEWQELMSRLKKLDNALCYTNYKNGIPYPCSRPK